LPPGFHSTYFGYMVANLLKVSANGCD